MDWLRLPVAVGFITTVVLAGVFGGAHASESWSWLQGAGLLATLATAIVQLLGERRH